VSKYEQVVYFEDTKNYLKDYLRKAMKASCRYLLTYQDLMKLDIYLARHLLIYQTMGIQNNNFCSNQ